MLAFVCFFLIYVLLFAIKLKVMTGSQMPTRDTKQHKKQIAMAIKK